MELIKDYWNNQPCNIKHSSNMIGTKKEPGTITTG